MAIGEARSLGHDAVHFSQIASCKGTREPDQTTRYPREGFDPLRAYKGTPSSGYTAGHTSHIYSPHGEGDDLDSR